MVEELLVADQLTEVMQTAGGSLVAALDKQRVLVKGAFWNFLPVERVWRLVIVSPEVRITGPKALYKRIRAALEKMGGPVLSTNDITVLDDRAPLYQLMRMAVGTASTSVNGIRLSRNTINGQFIEDAYIYRMVS